jgi:polar amino acid transport system substrate-binding protein
MERTHRRTFGRASLGAALVAVALVAAACSSGSSSSSSTTSASTATTLPTTVIPTQSKVAAVAELVPAAVTQSGQVTFAMDATYPPDEFTAPGSTDIIGMDADLGKAIAQTMGLAPILKNVTFDAIIPGLQAGKYDVGLSSFTDTKARQEVVDFVDYFQAGEAFYVKSGSSTTFSSTASLCGHSVAVETGTVEETDAKTADTTCQKAGKSAVQVLSFPTQTAVNLAVSSGRADVGFADSQVAGYVVAQSGGAFALSGEAFNVAPYGIATPKGNGMAPAIAAAVSHLMANGVYTQILKKWGVESGAVQSVSINGATS